MFRDSTSLSLPLGPKDKLPSATRAGWGFAFGSVRAYGIRDTNEFPLATTQQNQSKRLFHRFLRSVNSCHEPFATSFSVTLPNKIEYFY